MKKHPKNITLFIIATLMLSGFIAYLGFRTVEHEALLRHYQQQTLAQSRIDQVNRTIVDTLNQKAVRMHSIANFVQLDQQTINELISKDNDIEAVFILKKNQLLYPKPNTSLTQKEQIWLQAITPIINDVSLLYSYAYTDEQIEPQSGWYISNDNSDTLFIYWTKKDDKILGFKVPYIKLISDVINNLDIDYSPDFLQVKESDKLLYQSKSQTEQPTLKPLISQRLAYPLTNWQIDYYAKAGNATLIYFLGGILIVLLITIVGLVMFRIYREYTQSARLAKQQVNFVSQVSHELKTPLTNITLYAEMLKELQIEQEADSQILHYTNVITSESQRLARLIQNILTFTKASKVHIKPVNLNALLNRIVQTFMPAFEAKGIKVNLIINQDIMLETDEDRLTQIISNFLNNAEKYAAHGKQVDLIANADNSQNCVTIQVRDYGDGIAPKEFKFIFMPFYRINTAITEGVSGTGIGLTIAKQLAHNLKGDINIENCNPGVRFILTLPLNSNS